MTRWSKRCGVALGTLAVSTALATPTWAQAQYNVIDLAPTPIGVPIQASSINAAHQIVGTMANWGNLYQQIRWTGTQRLFLPTTNGGGISLSRGGGDFEPAYPSLPAINSVGQIASQLGRTLSGQPSPIDGSSGPQAAIWNGTTPTVLGTLGGRSSFATGLSDTNVPVGWSYTANDAAVHAFMYASPASFHPQPTMRDLGTLGGTNSAALAINKGRRTVGWSNIASGAEHAFCTLPRYEMLGGATLYKHQMYDLGTLGGTNSRALSINESSIAVGYSQVAGDVTTEAFLAQLNSQGGIAQRFSLGRLGTGNFATATDINSTNKVVGYGLLSDQETKHAWVWQAGVGMRDLNSLIPANSGWVLVEARSINDAGEIVGWGYKVTDNKVDPMLQIHPFWLRPIAQ